MFAVVIYHYDRGTVMFDRAVGGFESEEAALKWAKIVNEFVPGQDFSVIEVEHVDGTD